MKPSVQQANEIIPNKVEYNVLPFVFNDVIYHLKSIIKTGPNDFKYGIYTLMDIAAKLTNLPDDEIEEKIDKSLRLIKISFNLDNPDEPNDDIDKYIIEILYFLIGYLKFYNITDVKKIVVMNNYAIFLH